MSEQTCCDKNISEQFTCGQLRLEVDRLKAGLKSSELSRATLSGLYHDLERQLAEVKHELETTQLHLMEEETTRKIWEQDCKKAESQLAEARAEVEMLQFDLDYCGTPKEISEVRNQAVRQCLKIVEEHCNSFGYHILKHIKAKFGLEG